MNAVKANGCTPLHPAAAAGRTEIFCELIEFDATKSVVAVRYGTLFHQAALNGHLVTIVAMLEDRCPYDEVDINGSTIMHFAAGGGHVDAFRELINRGCDVNAVNAIGCTPFHEAAASGGTEAVRELIKVGATKSVVAGEYGTPVNQAAIYGHVETVAAILKDEFCETDFNKHDVKASVSEDSEGSVLGICNSVGQAPIMWAVRGGHMVLFQLLISKGAGISDRDTYSVSTLEQCFVGGHASKLSQFSLRSLSVNHW